MQIPVPEVYIDRHTAAKIAGMSVQWLKTMDCKGIGPPRIRLGEGFGRTRYNVESFMSWLAAHRVEPARADGAKTHVV